MAGNKLWSTQEDELIDNTIMNLPHRTDIEIASILFGHPLLICRTENGLLQHVRQQRFKLEKLAEYALTYRTFKGDLEVSRSYEMSYPFIRGRRS
ncbi:hypothetical protein [Neobacillus vireti]|uniref:hypothetical protein n=1 Tax=Neobacillus vireti TaxID=220686 RepID=UPI003000B370